MNGAVSIVLAVQCVLIGASVFVWVWRWWVGGRRKSGDAYIARAQSFYSDDGVEKSDDGVDEVEHRSVLNQKSIV